MAIRTRSGPGGGRQRPFRLDGSGRRKTRVEVQRQLGRGRGRAFPVLEELGTGQARAGVVGLGRLGGGPVTTFRCAAESGAGQADHRAVSVPTAPRVGIRFFHERAG
jgi:hypothetical protein